MKKYFAVAVGLLVAVLLSGCCSLCSSGNTSVAGSWQMYGLDNDGKLASVPVEMAFGTDGTLTTVIEQKDIRKSRWKAEGKYDLNKAYCLIFLHRKEMFQKNRRISSCYEKYSSCRYELCFLHI